MARRAWGAGVTAVTLLLAVERASRSVPVEQLACELARAAELPCYNEREGLLSPRPLHLFSLYAKELRVKDLARLQRWLGLGVDGTDSSGATALHYAAHAGNCWAVQLLLAREANPLARDINNRTARDLLSRNHADVLTRLVCVKLLVLSERLPWSRVLAETQHQWRSLPPSSSTSAGLGFVSVDRIDMAALDLAQFRRDYSFGRPLVVTNSLKSFNLSSWSPADLADDCGDKRFPTSRYSPSSTKWAKLDDASPSKIRDFIADRQLFIEDESHRVRNGAETQTRIFDQRVLGRCPRLSAELTLPQLFAMDLRRSYAPAVVGETGLPEVSQPSLFIDPAGVKSGLHIDSGGTSFMLMVLRGSKTVRLVHRAAEHLLRSDDFHDQNQLNFLVDLFEPEPYRRSHPGLYALDGKGWETTLTAGDTIYVPAGTPHQVRAQFDPATACVCLSAASATRRSHLRCCCRRRRHRRSRTFRSSQRRTRSPSA
jgi:hypothetical protein